MDGADEQVTADLTGNISGWNGTTVTSIATDLTSGGQTVYYYVDPADTSTLLATTEVGNSDATVFTLSVYPGTDSYTLQMQAKLDGKQDFDFNLTDTNIGGGKYEYYIITTTGEIVPSNDDTLPNEKIAAFSLSANEDGKKVQGSTNGIGIENQWVAPREGGMIVDFGLPDYDHPDHQNPRDVLAIGGEVSFTVDIKSNDSVTIKYYLYDQYGNDLSTGSNTLSGGSGTLSISYTDAISAVKLEAVSGEFRLTNAEFATTSHMYDINEEFIVAITDADGDMIQGVIPIEFDNDGIDQTQTTPDTSYDTGFEAGYAAIGGDEAYIAGGNESGIDLLASESLIDTDSTEQNDVAGVTAQVASENNGEEFASIPDATDPANTNTNPDSGGQATQSEQDVAADSDGVAADSGEGTNSVADTPAGSGTSSGSTQVETLASSDAAPAADDSNTGSTEPAEDNTSDPQVELTADGSNDQKGGEAKNSEAGGKEEAAVAGGAGGVAEADAGGPAPAEEAGAGTLAQDLEQSGSQELFANTGTNDAAGEMETASFDADTTAGYGDTSMDELTQQPGDHNIV
jgi:hypothetical protein